MAAALALFGCGGDANPNQDRFTPFARSGTRIVFDGYRIAGFEYVESRIDVELDVECDFRVASDGITRCLPSLDTPRQVYLGSTCDGPPVLVRRRSSCVSPRYATWRQSPRVVCEPYVYVVEELTSRNAPAVTLYERLASGLCEVSSVNDDLPAFDFFDGEVIPPTRFVAQNISQEHNADGLGVTIGRGDDGSRWVIGVHEARYGWVWPMEIEGRGSRFVPSHSAWNPGYDFADFTCTIPAAWASSCDSEKPAWAISYANDARTEYVVNEVGDEVTAWYQREPDGSCAALVSGSGRGFRLGPVAPNADLAVANDAQVVDVVSMSVTEAASGEVVSLGSLSFGGTRCSPHRDGDLIRCQPIVSNQNLLRVLHFRDAQCAQPIHRLDDGQATGDWLHGEPPPWDYCEPIGPATAEWYRIGAEHLGEVWLFSGGACLPIGNAPNVKYHVPEPVPLDTFPALDHVRL